VVVPQEIAEELLGRLRHQRDANAAYFESVRQGDFSNAWVDRILDQAGCPSPMPGAAPDGRSNQNGEPTKPAVVK
jgi:hypothetical protein